MTPSPTSDPSAHALLRPKLPIGIQSFAKLREQNCYYVDKTALAMQLIDSGTYYFLSRPRRFGKSLFLDTLREMFEVIRLCSLVWPLKTAGIGRSNTQ